MEKHTNKDQNPTDNEPTQDSESNTSSAPRMDEKVYSKWLRDHTYISGMMAFMMFIIIVGGVGGIFIAISFYNSDDFLNPYVRLANIAIEIINFCIAGYTLYTFLRRKPNAVFWGYSYMTLTFVTGLFVCYSFAKGNYSECIRDFILGIVWYLTWILFLYTSPKVNQVIPPSFRRITSFDWSALALLILLPITLIFIGLTQIEAQADLHKVEEQKMLSQPLDSLQRTDGKVIFTLPEGFTCEPREVTLNDGSLFTLFDLANEEDNCNATLCSDYDTDMSKANIETYWTNWRDEETDNYESTTVTMGTSQINGSDCVYRVMKYDINSVDVYWHFYLMFNEETDKVFVASIYNTSETATYINELLESVKFQ
jgi:hypothetical protein